MILLLSAMAILIGATTVAFGVVVAGIRKTDRQMSLGHPASNGADAFARKITGAYSECRTMRVRTTRR